MEKLKMKKKREIQMQNNNVKKKKAETPMMDSPMDEDNMDASPDTTKQNHEVTKNTQQEIQHNKNIPTQNTNAPVPLPSNMADNTDMQTLTYTENDKGPLFKLILEKEHIDEITTGQILKRMHITSVTELKKTNKNRIMLTLKDKKEANKLINNVNLTKLHQIKSFIPKSFVVTVGVIRDVPLSLTDEELMDEYRVPGDIRINKIERMTYWDKETRQAMPSRNLKIEFRSSSLPQEMILFYTRKTVEHFIPKPVICRKCLRYGHVDKICRAPVRICAICTAETHAYGVDCPCEHCRRKCKNLCKFCNTNDHNSMQSICPENKKQMLIKKEMTINKATFIEAKKTIEQAAEPKPSFASVSSLTNTIEDLKNEILKLKQFNETIMERVLFADRIFEAIKLDNPTIISEAEKQIKQITTTEKPITQNTNPQKKTTQITTTENLSTQNTYPEISFSDNSAVQAIAGGNPTTSTQSPPTTTKPQFSSTQVADNILKKIDQFNQMHKQQESKT